MSVFQDITGKQFNHWKVIEYHGNGKWLCQCDCYGPDSLREVAGKALKNGTSKSCGHDTNKSKVSIGMRFNNWVVIGKSQKNGYWICQCQCENKTIKEITSYDLTHNKSTNCGCIRKMKIIQRNSAEREQLEGQHIWEWDVLEYVGDKYYLCRCSCDKIKRVAARDLKDGTSKSCGHNNGKNKLDDLSGKTFGSWQVLSYLGHKKYKCLCTKCNTTHSVLRNLLITGGSTQCSNCRNEGLKHNSLLKYKSSKYYSVERTFEQIDATDSKEKMLEFLNKHNLLNKPTYIIADALSLNSTVLLKYLHRYNLEYAINNSGSKGEDEVYNFIQSKGYSVVRHNRTVISPQELDIYIPEKKIAIEFNGDYWHSSSVIDKKYHQNKTIACAKKGVRLIHIFEYEWNNSDKKEKIKGLLNNILDTNTEVIYARNTIVKLIDKAEADDFLDNYHIQNHENTSKINIGTYYNNELIGVMTFGVPRFSDAYQYELLRLCWENDINVVGGLEKMFKYFINSVKPNSIITYSNLAKFTGNSYLKLGFKVIKDNPISEPNYAWINQKLNEVLTRYQTQKHKLVEAELGTESQTEDEIMQGLGFLKVYDSGNIKLEWRRQKDGRDTEHDGNNR